MDGRHIQLYKVKVIYSYNGRQNAMAETFLWAYRMDDENQFEYAYPLKWSRKKFGGLIEDHEELSEKVMEQSNVDFVSQFPMTVKEYNDWFAQQN